MEAGQCFKNEAEEPFLSTENGQHIKLALET